MEAAVVVFQCFGVATLMLSRLLPTTRWADRGRFAFVFAMIGLGASGTSCAWVGSEFALFAGGTMAVLLIVVILGGEPHRGRHRRTASPFMAV